MALIDELGRLRDDGLAAIAAAHDLTSLEAVRIALLGKKGSLTAALRGLGGLSAEERPAAGKVVELVRQQAA